jgi:glycosyltransferase involved in cell wall biosynthesis
VVSWIVKKSIHEFSRTQNERPRGVIVKSVTMVSWELDPFLTLGGTAYAIRRLADQLTELGIETRVLLPGWLDTWPGKDLPTLLMPMPLKMRTEFRDAPRLLQCDEFGRVALEVIEQIRTSVGSDAVIAHSLEGAMFIALSCAKRHAEPAVFWLHSLYDPPITELSNEQRQILPSRSLLASAVMMADVVVTSTGVLKDAGEFEWPNRLKELQQALRVASGEQRVLTVESTGCLPRVPSYEERKAIHSSNLEDLKGLRSPYVLFPGRPSVDKGFGFFAAIAERLRADNITCVAVQRPTTRAKLENRSRDAPVYWLPWLSQDELRDAMRNAACTVLPSITEGFGLAAAESISQGAATLYQQVGGHHCLDAYPNALPVQLTTSERAQLYDLWSEINEGQPDFWPIWSKHEIALKPLVDKWVEAIRSVVHSLDGTRDRTADTAFREQRVEEQWGNKLRNRIEVDSFGVRGLVTAFPFCLELEKRKR